MVFKDKNSPKTHDEVGQYRDPNSKDDRNVGWQQQSLTTQQDSKYKEGTGGIPGSNPASGDRPGPFTDKDLSRGVNDTPAKSPLMMGAYGAGALAIGYMLLKVLKKK